MKRQPWVRILVEAAAVLALFAVVGAGAGWLWRQLWDPPMGVVDQRQWLYLDFDAVGHLFGGTGLYTVIGFAAMLVAGVVAALACRGSELATLVVVALAGCVAALVAHQVGTAPNGPDPRLLALVLDDRTQLPGPLEVTGLPPYLAWPLGALVGLAGTYVFTTGVSAGVAEARRVDLAEQPGAPTHRG